MLLTYLVLRPGELLLEAAGLMPAFLGWMGLRAIFYDRLARVMRGYRYEPTAHDVLVCTYYKSGTNWAMQIAYQISMRGAGEYGNIHDVVAWPDEPLRGYSVTLDDPGPLAASPTDLRIIKSHLNFEHVPYSEEAKYICVLRDPKDVLVSSYHFSRDTAAGVLIPSVASWVEYFLTKEFLYGAWADHLHSFWRQRHRPNVLLLTFPEMKRDLPDTVRRVAEFLGVALTEEEFAEVVRKSGFAYMKGIDSKFYPPPLTPWATRKGSMIRKGKAGGSSELLTPAQQERVDDACRAELARLGSDFPYDEVFAKA